MTTMELLNTQVADNLSELGFTVSQRGFDLEAALNGVDNSIEILATVEGITVYVVSEDTDTTGTPTIPWIVLVNLQRAIEQALLDKANEISLRHERNAKLEANNDRH